MIPDPRLLGGLLALTLSSGLQADTGDRLLRKAQRYFSPLPEAMPGAEQDTPKRIELGKKLYFDPRLSSNDRQSCAICHPVGGGQAGMDNLATSPGAEGQQRTGQLAVQQPAAGLAESLVGGAAHQAMAELIAVWTARPEEATRAQLLGLLGKRALGPVEKVGQQGQRKLAANDGRVVKQFPIIHAKAVQATQYYRPHVRGQQPPLVDAGLLRHSRKVQSFLGQGSQHLGQEKGVALGLAIELQGQRIAAARDAQGAQQEDDVVFAECHKRQLYQPLLPGQLLAQRSQGLASSQSPVGDQGLVKDQVRRAVSTYQKQGLFPTLP